MIVLLSLAIAALLYGWGFARVRRAHRPFPPSAVLAFALALAALVIALFGPIDERATSSLTWHMVQHLILIGVVAPLLLLAAVPRLALAALPSGRAAALAAILRSPPARVLGHPAAAWLQFAAVLYATHFSPLYEAALEHEPVHAALHALYLGSALIFWAPLLAVAPAPHAPSHPVRLLAIFLAIPMSAFLGFALYVSQHVLYAHYAARSGALDDQAAAGATMWILGGAPLFIALLWCVADWGARERRLA